MPIDPQITQVPSTLLVATRNPGKMCELAGFLSGAPIELISLADIPECGEVPETGSTFAENAVLKASGYARRSGRWALADDSGLEVNALDGRPGVLSARYGGTDCSYDEKISTLLDEIAAAQSRDRKARFVCAMTVSDPLGRIAFEATGICDGSLASSPSGTNGFGYDPIFVPDGFDRTFGELEEAVKQQISHRARASREIIRYLLDFMGISLDQSNIRL